MAREIYSETMESLSEAAASQKIVAVGLRDRNLTLEGIVTIVGQRVFLRTEPDNFSGDKRKHITKFDAADVLYVVFYD